MKNLFVILSMVFSAASSQAAFQEGDTNLLGGVGLYGSRGIIGFSVDRFMTEHHAMTVAFGVDLTGAGTMLGYKYFSAKTNVGNSVWEKCLFIFDCDTHYFAGGGLQYAGATNMKYTESSGAEREYKSDPKWFGMVNLGVREIFKSKFTLDFELSYRNIFAGGSYEQTTGAPADDSKFIESGYRSVGSGVAVGYLF